MQVFFSFFVYKLIMNLPILILKSFQMTTSFLKKSFQKQVVFISFLMLSLLVLPLNSHAQEMTAHEVYSDVSSQDWFNPALTWAINENPALLAPATTGFMASPHRSITRGEASVILNRFKGENTYENGVSVFEDVKSNAFYYDAVNYLASVGIVGGYVDQATGLPNGYFGPQDLLTRGQAALLITRANDLEMDHSVFSPFADLSLNHYAYDAVLALYEIGGVNGYGDGTFRVDNDVTRAEFIQMLYGVENLDPTDPTDLVDPIDPTDPVDPVNPAEGPVFTPNENEVDFGSSALEGAEFQFTGHSNLQFTGRVYKPQGDGPFPGVVLVHGCPGSLYYSDTFQEERLSGQYADWGEQTAAKGAVAIVIDSLEARGFDVEEDICGTGGKVLHEAEERKFDVIDTAKYLANVKQVDSSKIAVASWSHGASSSVAAVERGLNPVLSTTGEYLIKWVMFNYGGCGFYGYYGGSYNDASSVGDYLNSVPLYMTWGTADDIPKRCEVFAEAARHLGASEKTGNEIQTRVYSGAQHTYAAADQDTKWTQADREARANAEDWFFNTLLPELR